MVLRAPFGYSLGCSIDILHGLELVNYVGTQEEYLVGVSLGTLSGLMIGTGEGYFVGLSLGLPLGSPLGSPNPGDEIPGTLSSAPLEMWFGSEVILFQCC